MTVVNQLGSAADLILILPDGFPDSSLVFLFPVCLEVFVQDIRKILSSGTTISASSFLDPRPHCPELMPKPSELIYKSSWVLSVFHNWEPQSIKTLVQYERLLLFHFSCLVGSKKVSRGSRHSHWITFCCSSSGRVAPVSAPNTISQNHHPVML